MDPFGKVVRHATTVIKSTPMAAATPATHSVVVTALWRMASRLVMMETQTIPTLAETIAT
jgi:hypothetical protein